jgi:hypothetical protein
MTNKRPTAEDARRLLLEYGVYSVSHIAQALDRKAAPVFGDVPISLIADMLEVTEVQNWSRTTRPTERNDSLFKPSYLIPKDDGKQYRSFLPEDLRDADETRLRAFATTSKNAFIRTRVFEILWARYRRHEDAMAAIASRFDCAKLADPERDWPGLVLNLGRLTTLMLSINLQERLGELVADLDAAIAMLADCSRPFSLLALADMVCNTLLTRKSGRELFTTGRAARWIERIEKVATHYRGDQHHGHDALMVLQAWHARWGQHAQARAVQRDIVEHFREIAGAAGADAAPLFHQRALQAALDFKLSDLSEKVRVGLLGAIKKTPPAFKTFLGSFKLPRELVAQVDMILEVNSQLPGAIRQLALLPGLLEIDAEKLAIESREQLKDLPMLALMPSVKYHPEGKVTHQSDGGEENVERHIAFLMGVHLAFVEALLGYFLGRASERFEDSTLYGALADWPHLPSHRGALLSVSAERFAKQDWVSSGVIVATVYEAVLRDLVRAGGYSALKLEPGGIQMDETLNSLLRASTVREMVGRDYCTIVEYVLCEPALGWNLRNEIAHGTARPEALSPVRVFLVWLLLIRLTCFVALPRESVSGSIDAEDVNPAI